MTTRGRLEKERIKAVKHEEQKAGVHDGAVYKACIKKDWRWFQVSLTFYPKVQWYVEEVSGLGHAEILPGTRKKLTDAFKAKLETWL